MQAKVKANAVKARGSMEPSQLNPKEEVKVNGPRVGRVIELQSSMKKGADAPTRETFNELIEERLSSMEDTEERLSSMEDTEEKFSSWETISDLTTLGEVGEFSVITIHAGFYQFEGLCGGSPSETGDQVLVQQEEQKQRRKLREQHLDEVLAGTTLDQVVKALAVHKREVSHQDAVLTFMHLFFDSNQKKQDAMFRGG